jgi:hypothetical protein
MVAAKDGRLTPRPVVLGPLVEGLRVIRSGLTKSDNVVIAGAQTVLPGMKAQLKKGVITPLTAAVGSAPPPLPVTPSGQATFAGR